MAPERIWLLSNGRACLGVVRPSCFLFSLFGPRDAAPLRSQALARPLPVLEALLMGWEVPTAHMHVFTIVLGGGSYPAKSGKNGSLHLPIKGEEEGRVGSKENSGGPG